MAEMTLTIQHEGKTYSGQIATIESTRLSSGDHGIFTATLHAKWKGGGIGVGGFVLDSPEKDVDGNHLGRVGTGYGADHIMEIIKTVGVDSWEQITGREVIVLFEGKSLWGSTAAGIAGITNESILIFKDHAETWKAKETN